MAEAVINPGPLAGQIAERESQESALRTDLGQKYQERDAHAADLAQRNAVESGTAEAELKTAQAMPVADRQSVELPKAPTGPIVDPKQYEQLSYGLVAMAMIGGALSKGDWLGVGASLNGALSGYIKGNQLGAQKEFQDYRAKFDAAAAKQTQLDNEYKDAWTRKNTTINQKLAEVRMIAVRQGRPDIVQLVQQKDIGTLERRLHDTTSATDRLRTQNEKIIAEVTKSQERNETMRSMHEDRMAMQAAILADRQNARGDATGQSADFSKRGADFLASLPPSDRNVVQGVADYSIDPKTLSTRGGHREKILNLAKQYDPSFDQKNYGTQSSAINRFATGKQGDTVRSLNVAIEHMDTARRLGAALENKDAPAFNKFANELATQLGRPAPTSFDAVKEIVADEVIKGVIGGGGALADREAAAKKIKSSSSPAQMNAVFDQWTELLGGQLKGLERQYEGATQRKDFRDRYLTERTREAVGKTHSGAGNAAPIVHEGYQFPNQAAADAYRKAKEAEAGEVPVTVKKR